VRAVSFSYYLRVVCSGGNGTYRPAVTTTVRGRRHLYRRLHQPEDDDGDGFTDCEDQDCFGKDGCPDGGSDVGIITASLPPAP
jgi:hypothetical protein